MTTGLPQGQSYSEQAVRENLDRGKRASDIINGLITAHDWDEIKDKWVAISLADGSCDGVIYDTRNDAIRHQHYEQQCAYVSFRNLMGGANPREMAIYLKFCADSYQAGMRLVDPDVQRGQKRDAGVDLLIPTSGWDALKRSMDQRLMAAQIRRINRHGR